MAGHEQKLQIFLFFDDGFFLFAALGAAYGTAKSGTGIAAMSVMRPELIMKSIIPVVMAGIIAIYGLVVAILIAGAIDEPGRYSLYKCVNFFLLMILIFFLLNFLAWKLHFLRKG